MSLAMDALIRSEGVIFIGYHVVSHGKMTRQAKNVVFINIFNMLQSKVVLLPDRTNQTRPKFVLPIEKFPSSSSNQGHCCQNISLHMSKPNPETIQKNKDLVDPCIT